MSISYAPRRKEGGGRARGRLTSPSFPPSLPQSTAVAAGILCGRPTRKDRRIISCSALLSSILIPEASATTAVSNGIAGRTHGRRTEHVGVLRGNLGSPLKGREGQDGWLDGSDGGRCILIDCVKQMPLPFASVACVRVWRGAVAGWLVDRTDVTLYDLFSPAPRPPSSALSSHPPSLMMTRPWPRPDSTSLSYESLDLGHICPDA